MEKYFRVQTRSSGLRVLAGPCPRCQHLLKSPLGEQPRAKFRAAFWKKRTPEEEHKETIVICGCGNPHALGEQETRMGCGTSWYLDLTIPP